MCFAICAKGKRQALKGDNLDEVHRIEVQAEVVDQMCSGEPNAARQVQVLFSSATVGANYFCTSTCLRPSFLLYSLVLVRSEDLSIFCNTVEDK